MSDSALNPAVVASLRQLTAPGEPDVLAEVLSLFLEEVPRRIDRLRGAWQMRDAAEMRRTAHSLKGSSGNIGAEALHAVCREMEDRARVGDVAGAGLMLDALDREYERVEEEISRLLAS